MERNLLRICHIPESLLAEITTAHLNSRWLIPKFRVLENGPQVVLLFTTAEVSVICRSFELANSVSWNMIQIVVSCGEIIKLTALEIKKNGQDDIKYRTLPKFQCRQINTVSLEN